MANTRAPQADGANRMYSARAKTYDQSWHVYQGFDFTRWANLEHGERLLDLAAGTGLVAIPARKAVGPSGSVTAVDITEDMMAVGRAKAEMEGLQIDWRCHDITDLDSMDPPLKVGGYDAITCASALALFENPLELVQSWVKWLRPGGRLLIDHPAEDSSVEGVAVEEALRTIRKNLPYYRIWVHSRRDMEKLVQGAGLIVDKSFTASGYWKPYELGDTPYEEIWREWLKKINIELSAEEDAKAWPTFRDGLVSRKHCIPTDDGRFHVVVGRKETSH